jgi:HAD superfamily hydrolase (TIGR01509 family)
MPLHAIFFDMDGVLVHSRALVSTYFEQAGLVLAGALGGTATAWREAAERAWARWDHDRFEWSADPLERYRQERLRTLRSICDQAAVAPPDDERCDALGHEIDAGIRASPAILVPGAGETLRALAQRYELHMATGNASWNAARVLDQYGVRERFGLLCGPDLIGVWKSDPAFYPTLFAAAGVEPSEAAVVDDGAGQLALASAAGARTVLVAAEGAASHGADAAIADVTQLPAALEALAAVRG